MLSVGTAKQGAELREFEDALRDAAKELPDVVADATGLADEVIKRAQSRASRVGPQAQRAAASLTREKGAELGVKLENTDDVPFAVGAEWGATHDIDRDTARGTWTGWNNLPDPSRDGYFLQPAAGEVLDDDEVLEQMLGTAVDDLLGRAFPD